MPRFLSFVLIILAFPVFAQQGDRIKEWDRLINEKKAEIVLNQIIDFTDSLTQNGLQDSLPVFLEVYGRALQGSNPSESTEKKLLEIVGDWEQILSNPSAKRKLNIALSSWYIYDGNTTAAYQSQLDALDWARKENPPKEKILTDLYIGLGGLAIKNMDLPAAKTHLREVLNKNFSEADPENIYFANSYLGNIAYFNSNLDSAAFYYQRAVDAINKLEDNPRNQYYRKSIISNNLAGVQMAQSDFQGAEESMNTSIASLEEYMKIELEPTEYQQILQSYFRSIDNLAGLFKQQGAYHRAKQLLELSFQRKQEEFGDKDLETAKSKILLGQVYFDVLENDKARLNLAEGLQLMRQLDEESSYWQADAIYALARLEDFEQNEAVADSLYLTAQALFDQVLEGDFDVIYLGFLRNYSRFLAENKRTKEAIKFSKLARDYLFEIGSENLQLEFNQTLNLAAIYELGEEYQSALKYTDEAFALLSRLIQKSNSPQDSLQALFFKPQAILVRNTSRYALGDRQDRALLESIEKELRDGLEIIDSQTDFLGEAYDINILFDLNQKYFEFLEKIELELYETSQNQVYLDRLLAYHEHARYRKIRSRLQKNKMVQFGGVPQEILQRENELKEQLQQSLNSGTQNLTRFRNVNQEWSQFLDTLKRSYPKYFQLHFETSESALSRVYSQLNSEVTYLRYLHIGDKWLLMTLHRDEKKLIALESKKIDNSLVELTKEASDKKFSHELLFKLYTQVWKPAKESINTHRVVIIPEGELFNLSFETLTNKQIQAWSELKDFSLLTDHSISYQYGLLFLESRENGSYNDQLVAFAPGFSDSMKSKYISSFLDNQRVDQSYLELIPQPFTKQLVDQISSKFDAKTFLENSSTVQNFKNWAGNNKIIHIGTHAFSSNVNPGDSRLVFAKSAENPKEPNELFASEIYQLDLSSELGVLLACESGKPSYSPGEGMISLAHAFNYSGTKSLLMGLWKIDEKASVQIASDFYEFLEEGISKDEALRKAKLAYLSQAKGRELEPGFWAGLILMGDPEAITLEPSYSWLLYVMSIIFFVGLFIFLRKKII